MLFVAESVGFKLCQLSQEKHKNVSENVKCGFDFHLHGETIGRSEAGMGHGANVYRLPLNADDNVGDKRQADGLGEVFGDPSHLRGATGGSHECRVSPDASIKC